MANLRAIRTRIKSVESTRQITKSMKMVAGAKLRRTQGALSALRRFADESEAMLQAAAQPCELPLLRPGPETGPVCHVLILGNRGLCGPYNQSLLRFAQERTEPGDLLISCGRWGKDQVGPVTQHFEISDAPDAGEAEALTKALKELWLRGEVREIRLVFQSFSSVLRQEPKALTLLPFSLPEAGAGRITLFEPDRRRVLEELTELCLLNRVHETLLEARTGEHAARMTAMTAAADNTEELIAELTLELNHLRQAAITTEISEIVGGASVL